MPDPRDELVRVETQRDELARLIVGAEVRSDREYADRECALMLLEWVLIRKNQEFTQAAMDLSLRDGCGPVTAQALQLIHEAGFPFLISAEVKRLTAGRPKGSKGKRAAKKGTVDHQVARVVAHEQQWCRSFRTFAEFAALPSHVLAIRLDKTPRILRPALCLCRRRPHRPGCAGARLLRRGRCDHYQSALVARGVARAGHALPEHRADMATAGRGLEANPPGGAVLAPLLGHRGDWPGEMDRGFQVYRQGQCLLVQVRFETHGRPRLSLARSGHRSRFDSNFKRRICEQCGKAYEQWQRSSSRFCSPACKQQAYRKRLIVTPSVTALSVTPSVTPAASDTVGEEFRYVRHADVERFAAEGWEPLPALDGTHHGEYSVLMRRVEQG